MQGQTRAEERAVFLLGPDQWDDGVEVSAPKWVVDALGPRGQSFSPRTVREALAVVLAKESVGEWHGIVMLPENQHPGEDDASFFERLESDPRLVAYVFVVPAKAKVVGTVLEGGMLLRDFKHGKKPRILLFLEEGTVKRDLGGGFEFLIRGKRTRYLRSLANRSEHVEVWSTLEELCDVLVRRILITL